MKGLGLLLGMRPKVAGILRSRLRVLARPLPEGHFRCGSYAI